jgi:hypothetical protein
MTCYYQDSSGAISQIYPNQQQGSALVEANRAIMIPDINQPTQIFSIEASDPGMQGASCFLSQRDLRAALPQEMRVVPLTPIAGMRNMQVLVDTYGKAAGNANGVGAATAAWRVMPRPQAAAQTAAPVPPKK